VTKSLDTSGRATRDAFLAKWEALRRKNIMLPTIGFLHSKHINCHL